MIDPAATSQLGIPGNAEGPVFREPWEAHAFAMAVVLHERGLFAWTEWASALADEIKRAQAAGDPDTGETYYRHWLNALERLVAAKGIATSDTMQRYQAAWDRAAGRTPPWPADRVAAGGFRGAGRNRLIAPPVANARCGPMAQ